MRSNVVLTEPSNIAAHVAAMAAQEPHARAVIAPAGRERGGRARYTHLTYQQLDRDSDAIALGLGAAGIGRGARAVLMVRPGLDFFSLVFALFKAGVVPVVLMTHGTTESSIRDALARAVEDGVVREKPQVIRIEREAQ